MIRLAALIALLLAAIPSWAQTDEQYIRYWKSEFPMTDFSKRSVDFGEILSGGPPRDGIPPIDEPAFVPVAEAEGLSDRDPVIGLVIDGEAKAYPLSVLMWHEIANDDLAGVPVAVTFCPLCNAAIVFDRRLDGRVLDFGTTGRLRHSDLVMYDRQTESWWQQFLGEAIIGELTGKRLKIIPSRLESFGNFRKRAPDGEVMVPSGRYVRNYGQNPYVGYDTLAQPFLFRGDLPEGLPPMMRVVSLGAEGAWSLPLVRQKGEIELPDGRLIRWTPGQVSALDENVISESRDVGNVTVTRIQDGQEIDVAHGIDFAFAYHAFYPDAPIHHVE
ncbi:MAG: DUF3179 domain-containing protein [Minwuia sp.]|uniref:DUF3179 domain-containing protein n=1 Tax=Minwuia sp. TaxID=2493630 RepID=UPI003A873D53